MWERVFVEIKRGVVEAYGFNNNDTNFTVDGCFCTIAWLCINVPKAAYEGIHEPHVQQYESDVDEPGVSDYQCQLLVADLV